MARYSGLSYFFSFFVFFALCLGQNGVYAFGAGNIPSFAYMEGRAFRHGDIEDTLADLLKKGAAGGAIASLISRGHKFNALDVKRVYFGNWLRDYSQAVDISSLKKIPLQTIINLCMVLGFMAHGYATQEFEVTVERLGVYLPTEHIDNPKGYGEGEDVRKYNPHLRGPVDPRELEIDPRTGMKNYIANEQGHWDTSKALVRRTLEKCIHYGRLYRSNGQKADEYEAFRLLGQALHTLEDFTAHSNFCELGLVSMGHHQVFVHVGDQVRVQAPNGRHVPPIVTGSFGPSDFIHSLLGEASDHLSSASVTDLNKELEKARSRSAAQTRGPGGPQVSPFDAVRDLLFKIPGSGGSEMTRDLERIRAGAAGGGKSPEQMSPQELHAAMWQVLSFRDTVSKKISIVIEKIPGLDALVEKIKDSLHIFVFTSLEPFLKPILKTATAQLQTVSGEVINNQEQFLVFNDPRASDPTHSFLSKDHFNLILNEPAGHIAKIIVAHTVKLTIKAWDDNNVNVHQITEDVLQCLFHPDFHNNNSQIQREMLQSLHDWINKVPNQHSVLQRLSKNAVRNHENIRMAGEGGAPAAQGSFAYQQAHEFQHALAGYAQGAPAITNAATLFTSFGDSKALSSSFPPSGVPAPSVQHSSYNSAQAGGDYSGFPSSGPPYGVAPPVGEHHGPPRPPHHEGYNPSYQSYAPPSQPYSPLGPHHDGSHGAYGSFPTAAPVFPETGPSFPGAPPSFPGEPSSRFPPAPGGYPPPPGEPPAFPGAPGGYGGSSAPGPFSFPESDPYNLGPTRFPGPGSSNPYYGGGGPGGW